MHVFFVVGKIVSVLERGLSDGQRKKKKKNEREQTKEGGGGYGQRKKKNNTKAAMKVMAPCRFS